MKDTLLRLLPHAVAVVVFITVSSIFFAPAYNGYELRQGDIAQFKGMSKEIVDYRDLFGEEPLWTNSMFSGMPAYQISLIQSRNVPLLIQSTFRKLFPGPVGTLVLAMISFYVLGLCLRVNPWLAMGAALAFGLSSIHILYLGAGHMSKVNAIALMPGVLGGVLLAFRGKLIHGAAVTLLFLGMHLAANHLQMTYYLLFLIGFVVVGEVIRLALAGRMPDALKTAAVLAVVALIAILPNMTNILTTYEYSKFTTRGTTELTIAPPGEGENNPDGLNREYMLEYSMARGEFWSLIVPNIKGGRTGALGSEPDLMKGVDRSYRDNVAQSNRYWGDQRFTGGAFYLGALIMALFIIAFFALNDALRWPFLILSALAVMLSWQNTNFIGDFFIDQVPLYSKFRDTKMILVVVSVMAPTLAMLLLNQLLQKEQQTQRKWLYIGSGVVTLMMIILLATPGALFDFTSSAEKAQFGQLLSDADGETQRFIRGFVNELEQVRQSILRADVARSFFFVLVAIALVFTLDRKWLKAPLVLGGFALFVTIDSLVINQRYLNSEKAGKEFVHWVPAIEKAFPQENGAADEVIYQREIAERTNLLKEINDYVAQQQKAAKPKLDKLNRIDREVFSERIRVAAQTAVLRMNSNYRVLSIRNPFNDARTSYYHQSIGGYHGAKLRRYQEMIEFYINPEIERFFDEAQTQGLGVLATMEFANMLNARYVIIDPNSEPLENPFANGNAWFVNDIDLAFSADDEMAQMESFRSKATAIVHEEFEANVPPAIVPDSTAEIRMTSYRTNHLTYTARCEQEQFAVFSEIWYPEGWQAYLNGEPVDHVRANYILRAMRVPKGEHTIEFRFEPKAYQTGQLWAGVGSGLFALLLLAALGSAYRKQGQQPE